MIGVCFWPAEKYFLTKQKSLLGYNPLKKLRILKKEHLVYTVWSTN